MPFPLLKSILWLVGTVLLLAMAIAGAMAGLGWSDHVWMNEVGAVVCGGAGVVGLIPVWVLSKRLPHGAAMGFLVGILFRMAVAGTVVLVVQWSDQPYARFLSYWIAGWYLVVLTIEVKLVSSHANALVTSTTPLSETS